MENQLLVKNKKRITIYDAALASVLFMVFNFAFMLIYKLVPINIRKNEFVYYIASFLIEFLFMLTAMSIAGLRQFKLFESIGAKKKINGKLVGYGFLIAVVSLFFFGSLTNVFVGFLNLIGYESQLAEVFPINNFGRYIIGIIISCAVPAICEEILFRGTIATGLKERGFKVALVVSALIFTLMHGNAEQTVHQFIVGLIVGYIFLKSGNLWLGVLVHFFNNFIAVTQLYIVNLAKGNISVDSSVEQQIVAMNPWVSLLLNFAFALVLACVGYYLISILVKKYLDENSKLNSKENQTNTTIVVEGEEQKTEMLIDGVPVDEISENNDEQEMLEEEFAEPDELEKDADKTKGLTVPTIVMFALSFTWMAFNWLSSLLMGFNIF